MRFTSLLIVSLAIGAAVGGAIGYSSVGPSATVAEMVDSSAEDDAAPAPTGPRVYCSELEYEFGVMQRSTSLSHEFVFENRGDEPLVLTPGRPTCKCTILDAPSEPIPPGGSTKVLVEWTANVPPGEFRQTAPIGTNDLRSPRIELQISGEVVRTAGLDPQEFDLGRFRAGETAVATAVLVSNDRDSFKLEAEPPVDEEGRPLATIEAAPLAADELPERAKSGYRITLTAADRLPLGFLASAAKLTTDLDGLEVVSPMMYAQIDGDITIRGRNYSEHNSQLNIGSIDGEEGFETNMLVVVRGEHADGATLEFVSADPEAIEVVVGEPEARGDATTHFKLTLRVPPGTPPMVRLATAQADAGEVRLRTNHPTTPELSFRVRFSVR